MKEIGLGERFTDSGKNTDLTVPFDTMVDGLRESQFGRKNTVDEMPPTIFQSRAMPTIIQYIERMKQCII